MSDHPHLLSPVKIGAVDIRNRIVSSAYQTNLGEAYRPTDRMIAYHAERARGGVGLIVLEGIRCHPTTRPARFNLTAWDREAIPSFRALVDEVHRHGAKVFAQLLHLGRAANPMETRLPLWSASQISAPTVFGSHRSVQTHAMTAAEIVELCDWYALCARNMIEAGFDGLEIHAGHGYLIQQFLSPLTNMRNDDYGGDLRSRARIALEVVDAVRGEIGSDAAFGVRISADELMPGGLTTADMTRVARWLEDTNQIDYMSVSQGTTEAYSHARQIPDMSFPPAPFVHFAEEIKSALSRVPVFAVCRIVDPDVAESIIAEGKADLVCMARAHIAEPHIGLKLAEGRATDIRQCIGCNQGCAGRINAGQTVGCLVNAEAGRELELGSIVAAPKAKTVVIVGGGPAGMEAARVAALRGHRVTLFEQARSLGGQLNTLVRAPHRKEFAKFADWLTRQLNSLGVHVILGVSADVSRIRQEEPEAVIVATGSVPTLPKLTGVHGSPIETISIDDVLHGRADAASVVVLLDDDGHHKAASTAEYLAAAGAVVHLVTRAESVAAEITSVSRTLAVERLEAAGVIIHTGRWFREALGSKVVLEAMGRGDLDEIPDANFIVAAVPNERRADLAEQLRGAPDFPEVSVVGDCLAPRRVIEAVREGHLAARAL
jgi:2,4-dienoyl-CoA reductase-like NADH-dependent reductase (Old Yellow Enzyme family)/thioredoxin reductase